MEQNKSEPIEVTTIASYTRSFVGRAWVFQAINAWLVNKHKTGSFLLTGKPGSGKTAIASRLAQFSLNWVSAPDDLTYFRPNFLSAIYQCSSRDPSSITPQKFAESLALQLAVCYSEYATALLSDIVEASAPSLMVQQKVEHVDHGQVIGIYINQLVLTASATPEDIFYRLVRKPLEVLLQKRKGEQITILVDALDEALAYSGKTNIVSLLARTAAILPTQVRFLLTSRHDSRIMDEFLSATVMSLSSFEFDQHNQEDIVAYIESLWVDKRVSEENSEHRFSLSRTAFMEAMIQKAEGNMLYVQFLLTALAKNLFYTLNDLQRLPEGLGALYNEFLKRIVQSSMHDWRNGYAPLMGVLLVAQESLTVDQLQALTEQSPSITKSYLRNIDQLLEEVPSPNKNKKIRYRFYHQSFVDFLSFETYIVNKEQHLNNFYLSPREWHKIVADRCEKGNIDIIWQDVPDHPVEQGRREYARYYFITHLYQAREWERLFEVLDTGKYGQAKIRVDPSMHTYSLDLDLGRQAAALESWGIEDGIRYLAPLWRYTLLRCSLTNRANQYPPEAFSLMLMLGQESKALRLAELLTDQRRKIAILHLMASYFYELPEREQDATRILLHTRNIIEGSSLSEEAKWEALRELAEVYTKTKRWQDAEHVIFAISHSWQRERALLLVLVNAYIGVKQWQDAERIISSIVDSSLRGEALSDLGQAYGKAHQWHDAERVIFSIENKSWKGGALADLGKLYANANQLSDATRIWYDAEQVISTSSIFFELTFLRVKALLDLGDAYAKAQLWQDAARVCQDAEQVISSMEEYERADNMKLLAEAYVIVRQWKDAERIISSMKDETMKDETMRREVLIMLAKAYTETDQRQDAKRVWQDVERIISSIENETARIEALVELGKAYTEDVWQDTERIWTEIEQMISSIQYPISREEPLALLAKAYIQVNQLNDARRVSFSMKFFGRAEPLALLAKAYIQVNQFKDAEQVISAIDYESKRGEELAKLGKAYAEVNQEQEAARVWQTAERDISSLQKRYSIGHALATLGKAYTHARQWKNAELVLSSIKQHYYDNLKVEALNALGKAYFEANRLLDAVQVWQNAEHVIFSIKKEDERVEELTALGKIYAEVNREQDAVRIWREAENIVPTIQDELNKGTVLIKLGKAYAEVKRWQDAERILSFIEDEFRKGQALSELGKTYVEAKPWQNHYMIGPPHRKGHVFANLKHLWTIIKQQQNTICILREAERMISAIWWHERGEAIIELGKAYAEANLWQDAVRVWQAVEDLSSLKVAEDLSSLIKANTVLGSVKDLAELGISYAEANLWQDAVRVWQEAEVLATSIEKGIWNRGAAFGYLVQAYTKTKQWSEAERILPFATYAVEERAELGKAYVEVNLWQEAEHVISSITDGPRRVEEFIRLGQVHTKVNRYLDATRIWQKAEGMISSLPNTVKKGELLVDLGKIYAEIGLIPDVIRVWKEAEGILSLIVDESAKGKVLAQLGKTYTEANLWQEAEHVISSITDGPKRVTELIRLGKAHAQTNRYSDAAGIWQKAKDMLSSLPNNVEKGELLADLGKAYAETDQLPDASRMQKEVEHLFIEHFLHLIQYQWLQVREREEALDHFSLSFKLLPSHPALGLLLCEAFTWLDNFPLEIQT